MRKETRDKGWKLYDRLIYVHDCVTGLITAPYRCYPLNSTGLLHAADNARIYCVEEYQTKAADRCREIAINMLNHKAVKR